MREKRRGQREESEDLFNYKLLFELTISLPFLQPKNDNNSTSIAVNSNNDDREQSSREE
jgi:hypothetical protein